MTALPVRVRWVCCCWNETTIVKWILCGYFRIKNMTCLHYTTAVCNYYMVFVLYVMSARAFTRRRYVAKCCPNGWCDGDLWLSPKRTDTGAQDRRHTNTHTHKEKKKPATVTKLRGRRTHHVFTVEMVGNDCRLKDSPSIISHPLNARSSSILDRCWEMVCFSFSLHASIEHVLSWLGVFLSGIIQLNAPTQNAREGAKWVVIEWVAGSMSFQVCNVTRLHNIFFWKN